jgi:alkanesulfonate monooxygenase SsuD/methylene tetrahydromethanopterin reductase-like flavin-dependent oxidoreductase (luciferase family)
MVAAVEGRVSREESTLLSSPHRFKLGLFSTNAKSIPTTAEGALQVTWEESKRLALAADEAGLDAILPIGRWKGFGGESSYWDRSFETLAYAAGLAAITRQIHVFSTVHVPTIHPLRIAKEAATIDHIAGGRFGVNVVAGWNKDEIEMFGVPQRDHDERYRIADEWMTLIKRLWTTTEAFDFEGEYFASPGAYSTPAPVQDPYPLIMCAGISPAGQAFAAKHADLCYAVGSDLEAAAKVADSLKRPALEQYGRKILVFFSGQLICRDTEAEARRYFDYLVEHIDEAAYRRSLGAMAGQTYSVVQPSGPASARQFYDTGLVLLGSPEQIVDQLVAAADAGLDGIILKFVDYDDGVARLTEQILPLATDAGLRASPQRPD